MNYLDAIKRCIDGKLMTREAWAAEAGYVVALKGLQCLLRVSTIPKQDVAPWLAHLGDSLATDWKEFEVEAPKVEEKKEVEIEIVDAD